MSEMIESIRLFLKNPKTLKDFWDNDEIIWIDWSEYDEDIIHYVNERIGNTIEITNEENGKDYGEDIIIKYKDKSLLIPYEDEMDRDTTIISINEIIKPDYEIMLFLDSLKSDTLGFIVFEAGSLENLKSEFSKELIFKYFLPIKKESQMFNIFVDEL